MSRTTDTAIRRGLRTLLQLLAAGGFTALFDQVAKDVPSSYAPYVLIVSALVIAIAQNWLENEGYIRPVLGTKENLRA